MTTREVDCVPTDSWVDDRDFWAGRLADAPRPELAQGVGIAAADPTATNDGTWIRLPNLAQFRRMTRTGGGGPAAVVLATLAVYGHRRFGLTDMVAGLSVADVTVPVRVALTPYPNFETVVTRLGVDLRRTLRHRYLPDFDDPWPGPQARNWTLVGRQADDGSWQAVVPGADRSLFVRLFEWLLSDPGRPVGRFGLADDAEIQNLVWARNDTFREWDPTETVLSRFEALASRSPDAVALTFGTEVVSYADLDARANRLARWLIGLGTGPEALVGTVIRRSVDAVVAIYAILKAGGAYLPLDPSHPRDRIAYLLDTARPVCVLTTGTDELPVDGGLPVWRVDDLDLAGVSTAPVTNPERSAPLRPENLAYVLFTSGSTGRPKGVAVTHASVCNHLAFMQHQCPMDATDVVLHKTSATFDISTWEFFWPLQVGARVVITSPTQAAPEDIARLIRDQAITTLQFVPTMLGRHLNAVSEPFGDSVRRVLVAGECLTPQLAQRFAATCSAELHNFYGPTEATGANTAHKVTTPEQASMPIGAPTWNNRAYVLDVGLQPVPADTAGELYLAGAQLARCYQDRPDLTATRFVADPYTPGGRLYRTGDIVRWNGNGELEFLGRADFQVKLRGIRVELGEIESVLASCESVDQAVALMQGTTRLLGYVVPSAGRAIETDALRREISDFLPSSMVPDELIVLETFPVTASGKVDRGALPEPTHEPAVFRKPTNPVETTLAAVFAEVLGRDQVGVDESFFALGGDSIMSILLVSRAKSRGIWFTPQQVFEQRTVAGLAAVVTTADAAPPAGLEELPGAGVGEMPLTPAVRTLIEHGGGFSRFSQAMVLDLPAGITRDGLVSTIAAVVHRHDMLRSRLYRDAGGRWRLFADPPGSVDVAALVRRVEFAPSTEIGELAALAGSELDAALGRLDPSSGVVVQFVWLDPAADDCSQVARNDTTESGPPSLAGRLVVAAHHLAIDTVSWRILVPDFLSAWAQVAGGHVPVLPETGTSMRSWAHALTEVAYRADRVEEFSCWHGILDGPDPLIGGRPLDPTVDVASTLDHVRVELDVDDTAAVISTAPARYHAGAHEALLTALVLAVATWWSRHGRTVSSVLIRLEGHGREPAAAPGADLTRTVGWFTSFFPVRFDLAGTDIADAMAGDDAMGSAIKAVKQQLRSVPGKGIGYGLLRYLNAETGPLLPASEPGQLVFNYHGNVSAADIPERLAGAGWTRATDIGPLPRTPDHDMPVPAPITIDAIVLGGRLAAEFWFPWTLLGCETVRELADLWRAALLAIVRHVENPRARGHTPADFGLVRTSQRDIEAWEARHPTLVDVWPLAPAQAGLMFHAMFAEGSVDAYILQMVLTLEGDLDADRLRAATDAVLRRYPNLCTCFDTDESGAPVQLVLESVRTPWREADLRDHGDRIADDLERVLTQDRSTPFGLKSPPPLIRFTLARIDDGTWKFAVTNHHILFDGWSIPVLLRDLLTWYSDPGTALEPACSYRIFLEWLARQDRSLSRQVWRAALDGYAPTFLAPQGAHHRRLTALPMDYSLDLDEAETRVLATIAAATGVTMNTVLQCAWGLLLGRLTAAADVVFGATVSGRPAQLPGVESMVGLFINTVPVRMRLDPAEPGRALLARIQGEQADLAAHHYLGLSDIQTAAGAEAHGLFDTLLVFESYPFDPDDIRDTAATLGGVAITRLESCDATHYPLTLIARPGNNLRISASWNRDVFDPNMIRSILDHLHRVLTAVATDPDAPVGEIDILRPDERRLVLTRWNETTHHLDGSSTLASLFDRAAAEYADATALVTQHQQLSYGEFAARVYRLARYLISVGVGPETLVGLGMRRSIDLVTAMYAVVATGAGYVPLDPDHPVARNEHIIGIARPRFVLTTRADGFAPSTAVPMVATDELNLSGYSEAPIRDAERDTSLRPGNIAYVIFTSGSRGSPKGVAISHAAIVNQLMWMQSEFRLVASDAYLQKMAATFDGSLWGYFLPLQVGARLVLATSSGHRDPEYLAQTIAEQGITLTDFVPSMLAVFAAHLGAAGPPGRAPGADRIRSLRAIFVGGETLPQETVVAFAKHSDARVQNLYGPTEAAVSITSCRADPAVAHGTAPIGTPVWNSRVYLLDDQLRPVPDEVVGELYLAGVQLAQCYIGQRGLTASRFIANPFGSPRERLYRTGDLARRRRDGELCFVSRNDSQVKLRGQRIELGEIESALLAQDGVSQAVVVVTTRGENDQMVGYVVAAQGHSPSGEWLRAGLAKRLPYVMVPSAIVVLDVLPLNANGKVDRVALPDPAVDATELRTPSTLTEEMVAATFAEVLGVSRVGADSDFFSLGGNSLSAARVTTRLGAAMNTIIPVRLLFLARTVAELAEAILGADIADHTAEILEVDAQLDPAIDPGGASANSDVADILLTGATGFLGTHLLVALLERTDARIWCLVRAPSEEAATDRIPTRAGDLPIVPSLGRRPDRHVARRPYAARPRCRRVAARTACPPDRRDLSQRRASQSCRALHQGTSGECGWDERDSAARYKDEMQTCALYFDDIHGRCGGR